MSDPARPALSRPEWIRLAGLGGAVLGLHALGWGLFVWYSWRYPQLSGLGALAYTFGLKHAFDVDHIAAIDNTARRFLQNGTRSLGIGFFFSLGHSTVVFSLVTVLAIAAPAVTAHVAIVQDYGASLGTFVSATFLLLIGLLNLFVLADVHRGFRRIKQGHTDEMDALDRRLGNQGLMSRFFFKRLGDHIDASWKLYPIGALFGLGFDTASEIALLAVAAGVATHQIPFLAVISLPLIFAAGMSLMDTADGAFMSIAYSWAFADPIRKVYYNLTVTSLSVAVALVVGTAEILQLIATKLSLHAGRWNMVPGVRFGTLGYFVVGLFVTTWLFSVLVWKVRRIDEKWSHAS